MNEARETKPKTDLDKLLAILPDRIREPIQEHPQQQRLIEVVLDLGRAPEARFPDQVEYFDNLLVTQEDIDHCIEQVGDFGGDNRAGIERTLHRISALRNRRGAVIGLTCRIGRAVFGTIGLINDLVESGKSLLMLGRPGVGKTTALREIARVLADDFHKRVVIIDTSNEIAGDGDIPHSAIGRARRMQVSRPELQHQVMIEAVENHMPEVIVIDEIGTELEALAARTIAERGVQLVGTAHGNQLANLIKNPTLADLVGGIQAVTLGDEEARRRGSQKTVLERKADPTFAVAVEMMERQRWAIHRDVAQTIDELLRGQAPSTEVRFVDEETGQIETVVEQPTPAPGTSLGPSTPTAYSPRSKGLRASGRMTALQPLSPSSFAAKTAPVSLPSSWSVAAEPLTSQISHPGPNGEDWPIHVYPYGVSRSQIEQVIDILQLPISLTKDIASADAVLALRSHIKNHSKLRQLAQSRQVPIYAIKSNTIPQITQGFRRLLNLEDPRDAGVADLRLFSRNGDEDELEALEEARLAVEQIVIPTGQPVELLPRSAKVRKMQHELVEHYRLQSDSFGDEPNRRLRIFPA
ncbi:MAG: R3H domain-containing nucleic acid-binding protein [Cyanobacteria bacterium P01_H01_bin.15]